MPARSVTRVAAGDWAAHHWASETSPFTSYNLTAGLPRGPDNTAFTAFAPAALRRMMDWISGHPGYRFVGFPNVIGAAASRCIENSRKSSHEPRSAAALSAAKFILPLPKSGQVPILLGNQRRRAQDERSL
jgi:hypothetical protein